MYGKMKEKLLATCKRVSIINITCVYCSITSTLSCSVCHVYLIMRAGFVIQCIVFQCMQESVTTRGSSVKAYPGEYSQGALCCSVLKFIPVTDVMLMNVRCKRGHIDSYVTMLLQQH